MKVKIGKLKIMLLSALLMFTACGNEDKSDDMVLSERMNDEKNVISEETTYPDNIYDSLEMALSYGPGEYSMSGNISLEIAENAGIETDFSKIDFWVSGISNAGNLSANLAYELYDTEGKSVGKLEETELVRSIGDRAFINIDGIFKLAGIETKEEVGSFGLLLPGYDNKTVSDYNSKLAWLYDGAIEALLSGAEITGDNGNFKAEFKETQDYVKSTEIFFAWVKENAGEIEKLYDETLKMGDYKSYAERLMDDLADDLKASAKLLNLESVINEQSIEELRKELADMFENGQFSYESISTIIKSFEKELGDNDYAELKDILNSMIKKDISLSIRLGEHGYILSVKASLQEEKDYTVNIELVYEFEEKDVELTVPEKTVKLDGIVEYVLGNPGQFSNLVSGLLESRVRAEQ